MNEQNFGSMARSSFRGKQPRQINRTTDSKEQQQHLRERVFDEQQKHTSGPSMLGAD